MTNERPMPHDQNGRPLKGGDTVRLLCQVLNIHATEQDCNVDLAVLGPPKEYLPQISCNSRLAEKLDLHTDEECGSRTRCEVARTKRLRQQLDAVLQDVKIIGALTPNLAAGGRELALVRTKIEEAILWAGMRLKAINDAEPGVAPDPYPESRNPASPVVEPASDGVFNDPPMTAPAGPGAGAPGDQPGAGRN
jgi:hypothetical protein